MISPETHIQATKYERDEWLKQYEHALDLYKLYWNLTNRVMAFYVVAIGASLSFYVTHTEFESIHLVLSFCLLFSLLIMVLCFYGVYAAGDLSEWAKTIGLIALDWPYCFIAIPLQVFLALNGILGFVISYGCSHLLSLFLEKHRLVFVVSLEGLSSSLFALGVVITAGVYYWRFRNKNDDYNPDQQTEGEQH